MPINANFEYANAEGKYHSAQTDQEKLTALEEMIKTMPSHKGAENLRKNLRTRYKKLKQGLIKSKKKKKRKDRNKKRTFTSNFNRIDKFWKILNT